MTVIEAETALLRALSDEHESYIDETVEEMFVDGVPAAISTMEQSLSEELVRRRAEAKTKAHNAARVEVTVNDRGEVALVDDSEDDDNGEPKSMKQ